MNNRITTDQVAELLAQDKSGRVTREFLQAFLRNPQGYPNGKPSEYLVTVDYGLKLSEMVEAGQYDWKNDDITEKSFPVKGKGIVETNLELVHLNKVANTDEVEAYLDANGLRAATIEEFLAFGAKYPDVQRGFPVIALGSSLVDRDGYRLVPYFYRSGAGRDLRLRWDGYRWGEGCRFLAVRK